MHAGKSEGACPCHVISCACGETGPHCHQLDDPGQIRKAHAPGVTLQSRQERKRGNGEGQQRGAERCSNQAVGLQYATSAHASCLCIQIAHTMHMLPTTCALCVPSTRALLQLHSHSQHCVCMTGARSNCGILQHKRGMHRRNDLSGTAGHRAYTHKVGVFVDI